MIEGSTLVDGTLVEVLVSWLSQDGWNLEMVVIHLIIIVFRIFLLK